MTHTRPRSRAPFAAMEPSEGFRLSSSSQTPWVLQGPSHLVKAMGRQKGSKLQGLIRLQRKLLDRSLCHGGVDILQQPLRHILLQDMIRPYPERGETRPEPVGLHRLVLVPVMMLWGGLFDVRCSLSPIPRRHQLLYVIQLPPSSAFQHGSQLQVFNEPKELQTICTI